MKRFFKHKTHNNNPFENMNNKKEDGETTMADEIKDTELNNEEVKETSEENNEEKIVEETENNQEESTGSDETEKLKAALEHLNNQYLRLAADFDNYRKRQAQEREALLKYGTEECMKKVIEVVDNFERAIKSVERIDDVDKMKETFFVLNKQLTDSLTKLGLEEIKCVGEKFDPILHEAVLQTKTEEYPEETVTQELQKGYKLGDKVLRPAMVAVAVKE